MRDLAAGALLAAVLGIGLWVDPAQAELPRRALLLAAGAASALFLLRHGAAIPRWAWILALLDVLWHGVSASLSLDPLRAWLGAPERGLGALDTLAWWLIALGFAAADAPTRRRVCAVAIGLALALALLAALEFHVDPGHRPGATLGNPAFLGGVLAISLPLCLLAPMPRALRWAGCALLLYALYLSGARGAWIAAVVAVAVSLWLATPMSPTQRFRAALIAAAGILAVLAAATRVDRPDSVAIRLALYQSALSPQIAPLQRSDGLTDPLADWRSWAGYGPESIEPVLTRRRDVELNRYEARGWDRLADRTHNRLLDRWIALGWPGVLLGLALAGLPLILLLRANADRRRRGAIAAGVWVAFGIDGMFGVPHTAIDLGGALALGALLAASPVALASARWRQSLRIAIGAVACLAAALSWRALQPGTALRQGWEQITARPSYSGLPGLMALEQLYLEDRDLVRADSRRQEWLRIAEHLGAAAPALPRAWHLLGWMRAAHADPDGAAQAWQRALALLDLAQADSPMTLAAARTRLADRVHAEDPAAAQRLLARAATELEALPPAQRDIHWQRSYAYISARQGRISDAILAYEAVLRLDPEDSASRTNLQALRAARP